MSDTHADVVNYWNERSGLGDMAGTKDLIAKQLEMQTLANNIPPGSSVADIGCGNGLTLAYLGKTIKGLNLFGVDNSDGMVVEANKHCEGEGVRACICNGSAMTWRPPKPLDLVYTERTLINLPDWESQKSAIYNILQCVRRGGTYLMMENSHDGLVAINRARYTLGLGVITTPWHNRYMRDAELATMYSNEYGYVDRIINYSAVYYYHSRVVNAWLAKQAGTEPAYDAEINKMALLEQPQILADTFPGQGRLWVWRRL
jgi:SAM-dependent methyltransferase